ncbi:hypothetical protein HK101_009177 [Irineochytrium annulatum]|nr:hypothetical protein HK101_009177 [Irineochytrium annulatum]
MDEDFADPWKSGSAGVLTPMQPTPLDAPAVLWTPTAGDPPLVANPTPTTHAAEVPEISTTPTPATTESLLGNGTADDHHHAITSAASLVVLNAITAPTSAESLPEPSPTPAWEIPEPAPPLGLPEKAVVVSEVEPTLQSLEEPPRQSLDRPASAVESKGGGSDFGEFADFATAPPPDAVTEALVDNAAAAVLVSKAASPAPQTPAVDDDDEFGDFGSNDFVETSQQDAPVAAVGAVVSTAAVGAKDDDDDFGDFGGSDDAMQGTTAPAPAPVSPLRLGDPLEEERIERILASTLTNMTMEQQDLALEFSAVLKEAFPVSKLPPGDEIVPPLQEPDPDADKAGSATTSSPLGKIVGGFNTEAKVRLPNAAFKEEEWYQLWLRLLKEAEYNENVSTRFRWKRSHIRRAFLQALDLNVANEELDQPGAAHSTNVAGSRSDAKAPTQSWSESTRRAESSRMSDVSGMGSPEKRPAPTKDMPSPGRATEPPVAIPPRGESMAPQSTFMEVDPKTADVLEAKRLCSLLEDELRQKSNMELEDLITQLALYQVKMQEQANFWLDSKEQLIMDAEMHNKMIASLVQYATQQASAKPTAKGKKPVKGKR